MLLFPIKIQNIPGLKRYVELFEKFEIDGFLIGNNFSVPAYDILELFTHYPLGELWLFIKEYRKGEPLSIEYSLLERELMDLERYKK